MTTLYLNHPEALEEGHLDRADHGLCDLLPQLQRIMRTEIPLTNAMCLQIIAYDPEGLKLSAPLAPNINDKGTAFSGSLGAILTLAGWGLTWLLMREQHLNGPIMIQDSTITYLHPVRRDFVALGHIPDPRAIMRFQSTLRKHGRARLPIRASICENNELRVIFAGRYVATSE